MTQIYPAIYSILTFITHHYKGSINLSRGWRWQKNVQSGRLSRALRFSLFQTLITGNCNFCQTCSSYFFKLAQRQIWIFEQLLIPPKNVITDQSFESLSDVIKRRENLLMINTWTRLLFHCRHFLMAEQRRESISCEPVLHLTLIQRETW